MVVTFLGLHENTVAPPPLLELLVPVQLVIFDVGLKLWVPADIVTEFFNIVNQVLAEHVVYQFSLIEVALLALL